ncbi:MAG: hypothetical protein OXL96_07790 [Candidatus Poribacteria bacterium]|nr:hypothetical protein [Candidatus Poribacteria bacterium]
MKTILTLSILFSLFVLPVGGQTPQPTVETKIAVIETEIGSLKDKVDDGFNNVQKNFDRLNNIIIACIGLPLAILAIGATVWGILANRHSKKDQTLEKQIEILTQEIETLKQQRIVNP